MCVSLRGECWRSAGYIGTEYAPARICANGFIVFSFDLCRPDGKTLILERAFVSLVCGVGFAGILTKQVTCVRAYGLHTVHICAEIYTADVC